MNDTRDMTFADFAASKGVGGKMFYTVAQVSDILGVPESTIRDEISAGRMKYHLPEGRKQGKLLRPEWVDEWIAGGVHVAA